MVNKYQTGGAAPQSSQQAQIQQAIMLICLATGEQPETVVAALKNGKENFKKVLEALQQGDVQSAKQMIQQLAGTPMARLGAKLNYIRGLKGACPEGQEVKYFKEGGRMKCKCVDKAAGGEKVKDGKKEIAEFKKACKGRKFEDGGKPQKPKKVEQPKKPAKLQKPIVNKDDTVHVNGKPFSITYSDGTKKNPKSPYPKYSNQQYINDRGTKDDKEAQKRVKKVDRVTKDEQMKCGGKAKKHQLGGNIVPIFQDGTLKGGIRYKIGKPYMYENNEGEGQEINSVPDKFGRQVTINRQVTPRNDGTLKNDTMYTAHMFTGLGDIPADGSGYQFIDRFGNRSEGTTPRKALGRPFDTWGDYFKYLLSLRNKNTQKPKPLSPRYHLSMAM